jgi:hypothetical protein
VVTVRQYPAYPSQRNCPLLTEPAEMSFQSTDYMAVMAPLRAIAPLTKCVAHREHQYIPAGREALALLPSCLRMLRQHSSLSNPQVLDRSVAYV